MNERVIGIDLALNGKHRASIWDSSTKQFLGKSFSVDRTHADFQLLVKRCQKNTDPDTALIFIMEPTSMAWLPLSCFLMANGYTIYLVNPQKVSSLRRFFGLNKSDRLDSETLARIYLIKPKSLHSLYLPQAITKSMDRFCRQRAKMVTRANAIKARLWHIMTFVNPKAVDAFNKDKHTQLGNAFFRNLISPYKIVELGLDGLTEFLAQHCHGTLDPDIPQKLLEASQSAIQIYQGYGDDHGLPFDLDDLQFEVNFELDLLKIYEEKIALLDKKIQALYLKLDPDKELQSVVGIGNTIAPIILAVTGDINRFANVRSYRGLLRFHPKKKQTSNQEKKGLHISKSSFWLLKRSFYLAAETARKWDVPMAAFYERLTSRGLHHDQAICAIANKLAGHVYAIMKRIANKNSNTNDVGYQFRDEQGKPITKKQAKEIITEKFPGVYEKQRRSKEQQRHNAQTVIPKSANHPNDRMQSITTKNTNERLNKTVSVNDLLKELIPQYFELNT